MKWTYVYRLAEGHPATQDWHRGEWAQQLSALPGVDRVVLHSARKAPQPENVSRSLNEFDGIGELYVADPTVIADVVMPLVDSVADRFSVLRGMLSEDDPEYDLLRDVPPQHYAHMSDPIAWKTGGPPVADEPTGQDLWRFTYFFTYRDDVAYAEGEDWYIGHHTREGKQLPGLVKYVTWRRSQTGAHWPQELRTRANGFVRYTELCFETFEQWHRACYAEGPRWRMPDLHPSGVWTDYHGLFLGPHADVDLQTAPAPPPKG